MLLHKVEYFVKLALITLKLFVILFVYCVVDWQQRRVAHKLIVGIKRFFNILNTEILDFLKNCGIGVIGFKLKLRLTDFRNDSVNEFNNLLVCFMTCHNAVEH